MSGGKRARAPAFITLYARSMRRGAALGSMLLITSCVLLNTSCGAKTGLLIPDADLPEDAGMDAPMDSGPDAQVCMPQPIALERRGAQVFLAIDRSNSMENNLAGGDPTPFEPSRWEVLGQVLGEVLLADEDPLLELGAKFYPGVDSMGSRTPEEACFVDTGVDVTPARGNAARVLSFFDTTLPAGGTPTAAALEEVRAFYESRPAPGIPRFVVLATDGGPNCNPDTGVPPSRCVCTGTPRDRFCDPASPFAPYNCLDDVRSVEVVRALFEDLGVPVYVIGIDDPSRPDLADVLDEMAVAGGRPRDDGDGRRFYSVRDIDDLSGALTTITESIARCVFDLDPVPPADATVELRVDGVFIPQDRTRTEGWDFTRPDRREVTLFGGACARVTETGGTVTADILCDEE